MYLVYRSVWDILNTVYQIQDTFMKLSKAQLAVLALIITNIIWGAAFPVYKWALENIEPFTFIFIRFFIAALLLLPFVGKDLHIDRKDYLKVGILAITGVTLTVTFWVLGLQNAPSINGAVIEATSPILLMLFAVFFLHEKLRIRTAIGTLISLSGVLFIILRPIIEQSSFDRLLGNLLFLLAAISAVVHALLVRDVINKYSALKLTFWSFLIGSLAVLPLALYETYLHGFLTDISFQGVFGLFYGTFFASLAAYSLFSYGMKSIKANESGIFLYIATITTVIVAYPLLGEAITPTFLLGALLVFIGIFIAENKFTFPPLHHVKK